MKQAPSVFFVWASAFVIFVGVGAQGGPARAADGSDQLPAACRSDSGPSITKERIGVVLMHGRNGSPRGYIAPLATHLEDRGVEVSTPDMPWSKNRRFDQDFDSAMEEIDKSAARGPLRRHRHRRWRRSRQHIPSPMMIVQRGLFPR